MKIDHIPEPILLFKNGSSTYSKIGLTHFGPYDAIKESHTNTIILSIIGTKELIYKTRKWVQLCNNNIESKPHGER